MGDGWAAYKDKLHLMDYQCCKLEHICGSETLSGLRSAVCAAASDVHCLQRKCRQIIERLDAHRQTQYCSDAADNNRFVVRNVQRVFVKFVVRLRKFMIS